jgi:hypothetical protein
MKTPITRTDRAFINLRAAQQSTAAQPPFSIAATVELADFDERQEAHDWANQPDKFSGRFTRDGKRSQRRYWFRFENVDDAVLFNMRWVGKLRITKRTRSRKKAGQ